MSKMIARLAVLAPLLLLAACVSESTAFHSPDGKQTVTCTGAGMGLISAMLAANALHECKENYLKAGYIEGPAPVQPTGTAAK